MKLVDAYLYPDNWSYLVQVVTPSRRHATTWPNSDLPIKSTRVEHQLNMDRSTEVFFHANTFEDVIYQIWANVLRPPEHCHKNIDIWSTFRPGWKQYWQMNNLNEMTGNKQDRKTEIYSVQRGYINTLNSMASGRCGCAIKTNYFHNNIRNKHLEHLCETVSLWIL